MRECSRRRGHCAVVPLAVAAAAGAAPPSRRSAVPFRYGLLHKIYLTVSVEIAMREVLGVSPQSWLFREENP